MHPFTINWEYKPKFYFPYFILFSRLCCFLHDESLSENNQCKWFQYESFNSRYLWPHHSRTNRERYMVWHN